MADDIILIAPGVGTHNTNSDELHATMDAVAAGGTLTPAQQKLANVFATGGPAQVKSFLSNIKTAAPENFVNAPAPKVPAFDINQLVLPGIRPTVQTSMGPGTAFALGDQDLAEDVENLRLENEKIAQEQKAADQRIRESLNRGVIPGGLTNRLGIPALNLSAQTQSLLSQAQKNQQKLRDETRRNLFQNIERRSSVIGQGNQSPIAGLF